jgi:hypothetical protein
MPSRFSHLAFSAAVLAPLGAWSTDALGQTYTVTSISPSGSVGSLASSTIASTLTLSPSGGFTPSNIRLSSGSVIYTVTVKCGAQNACNGAGANVAVRIQDTGGQIGRLMPLQNFTAAAGADSIVTAPSGSNPTTLTIGPIAKNRTGTFTIGFDIPLAATGATGPTTRTFQVLVAPAGSTPSNSGNGTLTATVFNPIAVGVTSNMNFGVLYRPTSGSGTVTLSTSGALTTSAGIAKGSGTSAAGFNVTGEGGQAFSLNVPGSFTMAAGGTASLTVTTTTSFAGTGTLTTQHLSGALGALGSFPFSVGGSFPFGSTTPTGAYVGNLVVGVNYN